MLNIGNQKLTKKEFYITKEGEIVCLILCIISLLCFFYQAKRIIFTLASDFVLLGGHYGEIFQDNRGALDRYILVLMHLGSEVVFLIVYSLSSLNYKLTRKLASLCLWLPGIYYILLGGRFMIAVEFLIFTFAMRNNNKNSFTHKQKMVVLLLAVVLSACFLTLFYTRQLYFTALTKYEFNTGDMILKEWAYWFYQLTDGAVNPFYDFCDYLAEAPYVFSAFCEFYKPQTTLWGLNLIRPINLLLNTVGAGVHPLVLIENEIYMGGKYSGFCYPLIVDFGHLFSLFAAVLIGYLFAYVFKYRNIKFWARCMSPCIYTSILFSPIYYFNVGRLDFIIVFVALLLFLLQRQIYSVSISE